MDPLSHAIVGGTAAALICRSPHLLASAIVCGMLAGMSPDLDVLLRSENNPMFGLKYHRFFTHSIIFIPLGAILVSAFLWPWLCKKLSFQRILLFCLAGIGMHGVLDAMTNYGTHLFWPFTNRRESWSIISIVDPVFTITLLGLLICTLRSKLRKYALFGALFAMSYWSFGFYQREQATEAMYELTKTRGHRVERFEVKPSIGNILVWRAQYMHEGHIYYDAFHTSPWRGNVTYEGGKLPKFAPPKNISATQKQDLEYFMFFSDGWLSYAPDSKNLIGDMRFSMLPDQAGPIWGIRLQPEKPDAHVLFENIRNRSAGDIEHLWMMIKGAAKE